MRLFFTVDVDRDVNAPAPGRVAAGSLEGGAVGPPRFSSSERGLRAISGILDDLGVRGTFFLEGRTAEAVDCSPAAGHRIGMHGYDHEDLTALGDDALREAVERSFEAVSDRASRPGCFRAPYMKADARVLEAVAATGVRADSSFYSEPGEPSSPRRDGGFDEFPVPKALDRGGRVITAYLWPMHEGRRRPADYIEMARGIGGDMVLADHSWHMVESRTTGVLGDKAARRAREDVREVLEGILDLGFRPEVVRPGLLRFVRRLRAPTHNLIGPT